MYELYNGSERLMGAIENRVSDPVFLHQLAELLYYEPEQLAQDVQALRDRLDQSEERL